MSELFDKISGGLAKMDGKQKLLVIGSSTVVLVGVLLFAVSGGNGVDEIRGGAPSRTGRVDTGTEALQAAVSAEAQRRIGEVEARAQEAEDRSEESIDKLKELSKKLDSSMARIEELENAPPPVVQAPDASAPGEFLDSSSKESESFDGGNNQPEWIGSAEPAVGSDGRVIPSKSTVIKPVPKPVKYANYVRIDPMTIGRGRTISAAVAEVGDTGGGTPNPVVIEVTKWMSPPGVNRELHLPLMKIRLLVAATGDRTLKSAKLEIRKMSMTFPNGQSFSKSVKGFIADTNGMPLVAGRLIDNSKKRLALAGTAGAIGGAGRLAQLVESTSQSTSSGSTVTSITGNAAPAMLGAGVSGFATAIQTEINRLNTSLKDYVVVPPGKKVEIIFEEGVTLTGLTVEMLAKYMHGGSIRDW